MEILEHPMTDIERYIFIGDSLTHGYGVKPGLGWVELLVENHCLPKDKVYNYGKDGDTLQGILNRIEVMKLSSRDLVCVMGASNDLLMGRSADYCLGKMIKIIKFIQARGSFLVVGLPPHFEVDVYDQNDILKAYKDDLKGYCQTHRIPYIDFYRVLRAASDANQVVFSGDVHPNEVGYQLMYEQAVQSLKNISK